jgi:hypothetical protein
VVVNVNKRIDLAAGIRTGYFAVLLLLVVQFLLGMAVNLFVTIATNHPGSNPPEYFGGVVQSVAWAVLHGPLLLVLHASLGLLLVIYSVNLLAQGIQTRTRRFTIPTSFGAFGILAAGFNGGSFLNYNQDFSSMIMAGFFAIAVVSYVIGLYIAPTNQSA